MFQTHQTHLSHVTVSELVKSVRGPHFNGQHQLALVVSLTVASDLQQCAGQLWVQDEQVLLQRLLTLVYSPGWADSVCTYKPQDKLQLNARQHDVTHPEIFNQVGFELSYSGSFQ